jgi:general secretion pathway protein A
MYKKFFSLKERPFKLVPDPEYYYLSKSHEEAMAHLTYAISQGDGFVEITGEVGTGKTMMCRVFLDNLDDKTEAAYIFNPKLGPKQLLKAINDEFGIPSDADDTKELIDALNVYLMEKKAEGKKVILLIDEAQNLAKNVLEQLRLLSNLETSKFKLLQIILVGQPELAQMLDSYELRQLGQRITLSCHLFPLTAKEIREYIDHRIHIASSKASIHFTRCACHLIYRYSAGIPRLINILCDRALLVAFSRNQKRITGHITRIAIQELAGRRDASRIGFKGISKPAALFGFAALALLVFFSYYHKSFNPLAVFKKITIQSPQNYPPDPAATEAAVTPAAPLKVKDKHPSTAGTEKELLSFLQDMDVRKARQLALESVLDRWGMEAVITPEMEALTDNYAFFRQAAAQSGLSVIRVACDFNLIKMLNLPAILEIKLPEYPAPGHLTIRKIDDRQITLSRARLNQLISVKLDILRPYCTGAVYIPWKNYLVYKGAIPRTIPHESVIVLKMHLHDIGFNQIDLNPYYDDQTEEAVKQIQLAYGLDPDGIVGPLTKIVLLNEKKSLKIPHIAYNRIDPS